MIISTQKTSCMQKRFLWREIFNEFSCGFRWFYKHNAGSLRRDFGLGAKKRPYSLIFSGVIFKVKLILITVHSQETFLDNFLKFLRENSEKATAFSEAPQKKDVMRLTL